MPSPPPHFRNLHDQSPSRHVSRALSMEGEHSHFGKKEDGGHISPFVAGSSNNDPSSVHVGPRNSTSVASFDANGNEGPPHRYKVSYSIKGDGLALSGQPLTTRNLTEYNDTNPTSSRRYANGQALDRPQALEAALLQLEVDVSPDTLAGSARDYAGMKPLARFLVEEGYWCPARRDPHSARGPGT